MAALLECDADEIVFTSCGTESNNAAINSALQFEPRGKHIVTSAVEHSAVRRHCEELMKRGCEVTFLRVDENGDVDLAEVEKAIRPDTAIVSVMWANNETGVLFPVEKIAEICRDKRVLFHTDAVQAVGKIPIRLRGSAINFLSLSAHKLHGPKGVGALYVKRRAPFLPSVIGGGQENARRAERGRLRTAAEHADQDRELAHEPVQARKRGRTERTQDEEEREERQAVLKSINKIAVVWQRSRHGAGEIASVTDT